MGDDAAESVDKPEESADPLAAVELDDAPVPTIVDAGAAEAFQKRAQLAEDRLGEVLGAYRKLKTENEGFRDRITRNLERRFDQRRERLLLKFIDILDNLDRALEATEQTYTGTPMIEGIILVRSQLLQVLQEEGLERIPVLGLPYDPSVAEAVETRPVTEPEHHHVVVKEVMRGYRLNGRVARASRVVVGDHASAQMVPEADDATELVGSEEMTATPEAAAIAEPEDDGPSVDALADAAAQSVLPDIDPSALMDEIQDSLVEDAQDTLPASADLLLDDVPSTVPDPEPEPAPEIAASADLADDDLVEAHLPPEPELLDAESELDQLLASPVRTEPAPPSAEPAEEIDLLKEVLADQDELAPPRPPIRKKAAR